MTDADEPHLQLGDSGEEVVLLQVRLYALGLFAAEPDGTFDLATENAVRDLQSTLGQDNDGEVSPLTWEGIRHLEQQYGIRYQYASPYDALAQLRYDREQAASLAAAAAGQLSEDGQWQWTGTAWEPFTAAVADDYVGQLSEDGWWRWDGARWQPV